MPNRVFAITGAFGALGSAVSKAAAAQGEKLALIDFASAPSASPSSGEVLVLGGVDLTDPAAAERAFAAAAERFGGVDVLLNIAGGFAWEEVEAGSPDTWLRLYRMNVLTALNAARAALPHVKRGTAGRIINVGANAALRAAAGMGAYSAAKGGVHALTQALAAELKASSVTVNAVLPSIIDTPANRADMPGADASAWVAPADLASVMLFLASEGAQAITGALVPVTGKV
jgi:NAD(P)-dependent dehydrogenase (short-subunit alcohol dehydrogenase family)